MSAIENRIYTKIVGDLFHVGHVRFLKAARELGSHLTVNVVPDERVAAYKGRLPLYGLEERMEIIAACRWVDEVIENGPKITTLNFMRSHNFHIYAFGASDAAELELKLSECAELPEEMRKRIPYTGGISSTLIRNQLKG